ncbi:MAG: hypothetical protein AAF212_00210 [Verrucomicrobiota bacterium]
MKSKSCALTLLSLTLSVVTLARSDDQQIYESLETLEKLRWDAALDQREKGVSDIKSGKWYLQRTDSSDTQKDTVARAHAAGKNLIQRGETAIAEAENTLQSLRNTVAERKKGATALTNQQAKRYDTAFELYASVEEAKSDLAQRILSASYGLGYNQIIFDAVYATEESQAVINSEWTQGLRKEMERIDGTRFSVKPEGAVALQDNRILFDEQPLGSQHILVYGFASSYSENPKSPELLSIHLVDPSSWHLKDILNISGFNGSFDPTKDLVLIEDSSRFFERISALPENYSFRLNYAWENLTSVNNGAWLPASLKEIALRHKLVDIVDTDSLRFLYGDADDKTTDFTSRGNATFTLNAANTGGNYLSLFGKSDSSAREILVGKIGSVSSL